MTSKSKYNIHVLDKEYPKGKLGCDFADYVIKNYHTSQYPNIYLAYPQDKKNANAYVYCYFSGGPTDEQKLEMQEQVHEYVQKYISKSITIFFSWPSKKEPKNIGYATILKKKSIFEPGTFRVGELESQILFLFICIIILIMTYLIAGPQACFNLILCTPVAMFLWFCISFFIYLINEGKE